MWNSEDADVETDTVKRAFTEEHSCIVATTPEVMTAAKERHRTAGLKPNSSAEDGRQQRTNREGPVVLLKGWKQTSPHE
jgi:hypothetical protein